jgi:hypothetical protein
MRGYKGFEEFISSRGGIVTRKELLAAGWTPDDLRIAYGNYLRPTRIRRGWYCSREVPLEVRGAWAHGGPLACISALQWYGIVPTDVSDSAIHICVPRHTKRRNVESHSPRPVVVHWHDLPAGGRNRWAVPPEVALEQARWCRAAAARTTT